MVVSVTYRRHRLTATAAETAVADGFRNGRRIHRVRVVIDGQAAGGIICIHLPDTRQPSDGGLKRTRAAGTEHVADWPGVALLEIVRWLIHGEAPHARRESALRMAP